MYRHDVPDSAGASCGALSQLKAGKRIVVCGAGDWVRKQYAPAVQHLSETRACQVSIVYDSAYIDSWPRLPAPERRQYQQSIEENVASFRSSGLRCLDIAAPADEYELASVTPSVSFVVTPPELHCRIAAQWLIRAETVVIEKPFDTDLAAVERMVRRVRDDTSCADVLAFDHYLGRAEPLRALYQTGWLTDFLEGRICHWNFEMLESSNDEEIVSRMPTLQSGIVMDLCAHGMALLSLVGNPATIEVKTVKAGVYQANPQLGVATCARNLMPDGMETFAEATFTFTSAFGEQAQGHVRVGKFVERSRKLLVIVGGRTGDRVVTADFVDNRLTCSRGHAHTDVGALRGAAVATMIHAIVHNEVPSSAGLMRVDEALRVMVALTRIHEPIAARVKSGLPLTEYVAGSSADEIGAELDLL
jgi:predicted dehydrogenase